MTGQEVRKEASAQGQQEEVRATGQAAVREERRQAEAFAGLPMGQQALLAFPREERGQWPLPAMRGVRGGEKAAQHGGEPFPKGRDDPVLCRSRTPKRCVLDLLCLHLFN